MSGDGNTARCRARRPKIRHAAISQPAGLKPPPRGFGSARNLPKSSVEEQQPRLWAQERLPAAKSAPRLRPMKGPARRDRVCGARETAGGSGESPPPPPSRPRLRITAADLERLGGREPPGQDRGNRLRPSIVLAGPPGGPPEEEFSGAPGAASYDQRPLTHGGLAPPPPPPPPPPLQHRQVSLAGNALRLQPAAAVLLLGQADPRSPVQQPSPRPLASAFDDRDPRVPIPPRPSWPGTRLPRRGGGWGGATS